MQDGLAWSKDTLKPEHSGMTLWKGSFLIIMISNNRTMKIKVVHDTNI